MLRSRLIFAFAIIAPLVALVAADYRLSGPATGGFLLPLGALIAMMAAGEVLGLLKAGGLRVVAWSTYLGVALIWVATAIPVYWPLSGEPYPVDCPMGALGWPLGAMAVGVVLAFVGEMRRYKQPGDSIAGVALSVMTIAYVGLMTSFLAALRTFHDNDWGLLALLSLIVIVKMADTGAYTFGKLFGKHKLAPVLSPGKTIEGAVGAIVTACLASLLFFRFAPPLLMGEQAVATSWWGAILYGGILAVVGVVGDLSESLLKRDMRQKDSSTWLPGLGGVLDVIDSVLVTAPAAFLCWVCGLVGPG